MDVVVGSSRQGLTPNPNSNPHPNLNPNLSPNPNPNLSPNPYPNPNPNPKLNPNPNPSPNPNPNSNPSPKPNPNPINLQPQPTPSLTPNLTPNLTPQAHDLPEFCSILNEALRVDLGHYSDQAGTYSMPVSAMLQPAVVLTAILQRFLNASRRVKEETVKKHDAWPSGNGEDSTKKNTVFRGGGLPTKHFGFFKRLEESKQWYRVAHPLATSFMKNKARFFVRRQNGRPDPFDPGK